MIARTSGDFLAPLPVGRTFGSSEVATPRRRTRIDEQPVATDVMAA
jgi:hypothetical protein